jgi:hypothetical protein
MFSPAQLPVKSAIAREFGVFNKFFSAVPSASTPNHLFTQSATSCGVADNILYDQCGGETATYPQVTIYDTLSLQNKTFGFYVNTTVPHACDDYPTTCDDSAGWSEFGDANYPDVMMEGIGRHQDHFYDYATFFEQASNGTLPHFTWIAPNNSYSDHPCNDVAKGERLTKDIYEAVRAGPGWSKTLLAVLYDDAGGVYDHVVPPNAPADLSPCNVDNGPPPPLHETYGERIDGEQVRLLTEEERALATSLRGPPMPPPRHPHGSRNNNIYNGNTNSGNGRGNGSSNGTFKHNASGNGNGTRNGTYNGTYTGFDRLWRFAHNATSPPPAHSTQVAAGASPPDLDGETWVLLNTYNGANTLVSWSYSAPNNYSNDMEWMKVDYTVAKDG